MTKKNETLYAPGEWKGECFNCSVADKMSITASLKRIECSACGFEGMYVEDGDTIIIYEESIEA